MKGHYIIEGKFDEAQEIDRDVLRRPKMLPVEEDVTLVRRRYTGQRLHCRKYRKK